MNKIENQKVADYVGMEDSKAISVELVKEIDEVFPESVKVYLVKTKKNNEWYVFDSKYMPLNLYIKGKFSDAEEHDIDQWFSFHLGLTMRFQGVMTK